MIKRNGIKTLNHPDYVYALAASPNFVQDGRCYAGRASGLYTSLNLGKTWKSMYASLDLPAPLPTLTIAIANEGEGQQTLYAGVIDGVLCTSNGGKNWQRSVFPAPPPFVSAITISPNYSKDGLVFAATLENGIYRTDDQGQHWVSSNSGLLDLNVLALLISPDFAQDEMIFSATSSGIFRSVNSGLTWQKTGFPPKYAPVLSLAYFAGEEGVGRCLYAGTEASGLFVSQDDAETWKPFSQGRFTEPINCLLTYPAPLPSHRLLVATGEQLHLTQDGGRNWLYFDRGALNIDESVSAICAPAGLEPFKSVLVGGLNGAIRVISL